MDLENKLKGLPPIYYTNLDNRTDRREYMESQFDHWGIKDYHRVSGTKYLASKHEEWKNVYYENSYYKMIPQCIGNLITHLEMIKNWLETTNEPYMIMMEDDYDLSLIEYWNFDWEYLMNNIPENWDCIQLGFESLTKYHFFLHPKLEFSYFGPCMINRHYAQKLIKLHHIDGKYKIYNKVSDFNFIYSDFFSGTATVDYSIAKTGKTYCIPLICINTNFLSFENYEKINRTCQKQARKLMYNWWKNEHHKFTLEEFFTYGKPNYDEMTKKIKLETLQGKLTYM
jgi:hypothetical protein